MHYHIDQGLQKNASFVYNNFLPEEIDAFINKMILRFIKDRFDKTDQEELGFEAVQKRLDDIRELIEPHSDTFVSEVEGADTDSALPGDYLFYIAGYAVTGYDDCKLVADATKNYKVPLRIIPQNEIYKLLKDPFSVSSPTNSILCTITKKTLRAYGGKKYILKGVTYDYVRTPAEVSLTLPTDCDLAEHTHDEIVDLTVQHILEVIQNPRYQTNTLQSRKME